MKFRILLLLTAMACAQEPAPAGRYEKGARHFFSGDIKAALVEWDAQVKETPSALPEHWQRGIALYYAERYEDGQKQFEVHRTVNPQDVENAVWHYLCVARLKDTAAARAGFIPVTNDTRVPMKEIHALYSGKGTVEAVLQAAESAAASSGRKLPLCYARLYCGLYYEAQGDTAKAKENLLKAAADFPQGNYMGDTARVHVKLRGWTTAPTPAPAKKAETPP